MLREVDDERPMASPPVSPTRRRTSSQAGIVSFAAVFNNLSGSNSNPPLPTSISSTTTGIPSAAGPNPAALPTWFLAKDPDPMMQALLENMLTVESSLLELRLKAKLFQDSADFVCRTMNDQASCYARLCKNHVILGSSTTLYAAITKTALQEKAFNRLCESLELKVYEPIKVNLEVLGEIKAHAHERDSIRRRSKGKGPMAASSPEFADLTVKLFDQLAALQHHRFDFIRGLYEGLKSAQRRFFTDISSALESPDLDVVTQPVLPVKPLISDRNGETSISVTSTITPAAPPAVPPKVNEVIVPSPVALKFDPSADQIKSSIAPAFSRFNEAKKNSLDVEEEDAWSSKMSAVKLPPATMPASAYSTRSKENSSVGGKRAARKVDEDDDSDFDTV